MQQHPRKFFVSEMILMMNIFVLFAFTGVNVRRDSWAMESKNVIKHAKKTASMEDAQIFPTLNAFVI